MLHLKICFQVSCTHNSSVGPWGPGPGATKPSSAVYSGQPVLIQWTGIIRHKQTSTG